PAPGFALVFLTDSSYNEATPQNPQTYSTTVVTKRVHPTVDPSVLATSNGHSGVDRKSISTTSKESKSVLNGAMSIGGMATPGIMAVIAVTLGAVMIERGAARVG